jgi:hypothetical protein
MRLLVGISSLPNCSISMIRALCISCTFGRRAAEFLGEGVAGKFDTFRKTYSSATSRSHGDIDALSSGAVYAAPAMKIARSRGFDTFPGSNVGK